MRHARLQQDRGRAEVDDGEAGVHRRPVVVDHGEDAGVGGGARVDGARVGRAGKGEHRVAW